MPMHASQHKTTSFERPCTFHVRSVRRLPTRRGYVPLRRIDRSADGSVFGRVSGTSNRARSRTSLHISSDASSDGGGFFDAQFRPGVTRRRALISFGEVALDLGLAAWFELNFRPKAPGDEEMNVLQSVTSLLPYETDPDVKEAAKDAVRLGRKLANSGDDAGAIEQFGRAMELAPRDYLISQAARADRHDAYERLGDKERAGDDGFNQWCWGRGIRFPGHYIISYILARRAFVGDGPGSRRNIWKQSSSASGSSASPSSSPEQQQQQSAVTYTEIGIIVALAATWNLLFYFTNYT